MIRSLYTASTGMKAQQTNMDVQAHNIANVSTTGFKKSRAEFEDLMYQTNVEPGAPTGQNTISPTGTVSALSAVRGPIPLTVVNRSKNVRSVGRINPMSVGSNDPRAGSPPK